MALARHLRGLDVAMAEVDHRYSELYWAGQDRNWPYAAYQVEKLRLAVDLALERRPKRVASAQTYFYPVLAVVDSAVTRQDTARFRQGFEAFTAACNACHAAEEVAAFHVAGPGERRSTIRRAP